MNELRKNFCVFIMSYGRADNVITLNLLKRFHYTGDWFIVCSTDDPTLEEYRKRYDKDVNVYVMEAMRGGLFFTVMDACITQLQTQSNKGGMTEAYLDKGTYIKSFYSVICAPSAVYLSEMGSAHKRIHHHVRWNNCAPKIISDRYKKK